MREICGRVGGACEGDVSSYACIVLYLFVVYLAAVWPVHIVWHNMLTSSVNNELGSV